MSERNALGIDEERAVRIVRKAIASAGRDIELLVQRYLARGDTLGTASLERMAAALDSLAKAYGIKIARGEWGKMLIAAANAGAASLEGSTFSLSKAQLDMALYNAGIKIKGILADGILQVQEIIASAQIQGESIRDISRTIQEQLRVEGGPIDTFRAEMIAGNELFSVYRQAAKAAGDASGVTLYQMRGPVDKRTTPICLKHVGQVKTAEEWQAIKATVFSYGLHYRCRHSWDPVRDAEDGTVLTIHDQSRKRASALIRAAA